MHGSRLGKRSGRERLPKRGGAWFKWLVTGIVAAGLSGVLCHYFFSVVPRRNRAEANALCEKGNACLLKGQLPLAIDYYGKAIERDPNFVYAYNGMGMAYRARGDFAQAEHFLQKALSLDRNMVDTYNNLALAYISLGKPTEAIQEYEVSIRLNPRQSRAYYNLGLVYAEEGNYEKVSI